MAGSYWAFEPTLTQAGAKADLRIRVPMHELAAVAWAVAKKIAEGKGVALPTSAAEHCSQRTA